MKLVSRRGSSAGEYKVDLDRDGEKHPVTGLLLTPLKSGGASIRYELKLMKVNGFFQKLFGKNDELLVRVKMYVRSAPGQDENSTKQWYHSKDGGKTWQHYVKDPKWKTESLHFIDVK